MNLSVIKNKVVIMMAFAALFQLVSFIFSQVLVKIDEDLEKKNYILISNNIKLQDIDMHLDNVIPDLLIFSINQRLNSQLYIKYYNDKEYEESFSPVFQNLRFYFSYIKDDFFIQENNKLTKEIENIQNELDNIKNRPTHEKSLFLEKKLYPVFDQLTILRKSVTDEIKLLSLEKDNFKSIRHKINLSLVITQILNLLFLTLFFFFVFPESLRYFNVKND
jgi:hypothetical protein